MKAVCIVNPAAAGGRAGRGWPDLARRLAGAGVEAEACFTTGPGDATEQARRAIAEGATTVVAVGGDGTIHEVVNGFFAAGYPINPAARLGILPAGTGSDLARTLGIPSSHARAVERLAHGTARPIDLGRAAYVQRDGTPAACWFVNTASAGLPGFLIEKMRTLPAFLKGGVRYNAAVLLSMASYRPSTITATMDEQAPFASKQLMLVVGNGRYFGGGMHIAPDAVIDDGELDFVAVEFRGMPELLHAFVHLYAGTHVNLPLVEQGRGRQLRVESDVPLLLEIDGETPGYTPATFAVAPGALAVIC